MSDIDKHLKNICKELNTYVSDGFYFELKYDCISIYSYVGYSEWQLKFKNDQVIREVYKNYSYETKYSKKFLNFLEKNNLKCKKSYGSILDLYLDDYAVRQIKLDNLIKKCK